MKPITFCERCRGMNTGWNRKYLIHRIRCSGLVMTTSKTLIYSVLIAIFLFCFPISTPIVFSDQAATTEAQPPLPNTFGLTTSPMKPSRISSSCCCVTPLPIGRTASGSRARSSGVAVDTTSTRVWLPASWSLKAPGIRLPYPSVNRLESCRFIFQHGVNWPTWKTSTSSMLKTTSTWVPESSSGISPASASGMGWSGTRAVMARLTPSTDTWKRSDASIPATDRSDSRRDRRSFRSLAFSRS